MFRMWKTVQHLEQLGQTQTNASKPRRQESKKMPALRKSLREHAGLFHARAHPQPRLQVPVLRKMLLATVAAPRPHPHPHRYEFIFKFIHIFANPIFLQQAKNRSNARSATKLSPINPTYARTFKHTPTPNRTSAPVAAKPSP